MARKFSIPVVYQIEPGANLEYAKLNGQDLREADLRGANLKYADLRGVNLDGADLRGAKLRGADIGNATFRGANLHEAIVSYGPIGDDSHVTQLYETDFSGANLTKTVYKQCPSYKVIFDGAKLEGARFDDGSFNECSFKNVEFRNVGMFHAMFYACDLTGANFNKAVLGGNDFRFSDFSNADFRGCEMQRRGLMRFDYAQFHNADMRGVNLMGWFEYADFTNADLRCADINKAMNLEKAILEGLRIDQNTRGVTEEFLEVMKRFDVTEVVNRQ